MTTKDKVKAFVLQQNMIGSGDHILLGFSGGADSVCLFYILQTLAEEYDLKLTAVHVEHGIRGEEALRDADFVEKLCKKEGIPCYTEHVNIPAMAAEAGLSEEEMGRKVRYEIFAQLAKKVGANKIAVAHHKNDVAETMLFHLCRGTGLAGLCSLSPVRGNIIRPLLALEREEIETYLEENGFPYCTDSTNKDQTYTRNYLRGEVLPLLQEVNPRVIDHIAQTSLLLEGAKETLKGVLAEKKCRYVVMKCEDAFLKQELFEQENEYVITGVLQDVIEEIAGSKKDIHFKHMDSVARLGGLQVGKSVDLPYRLCAVREYEGIRIFKRETADKTDGAKVARFASCGEAGELQEMSGRADFEEVAVAIPGKTVLRDGTIVETRLFAAEEIKELDKIPDKKYTKWFDYGIIKECLWVRHRQAGDYMQVDASGGRKRLKDLLINEKVPQSMRDEIWLIACESLVLWAVGVRMGEWGKLHSNTEQILEIKIHGGRDNE